MQAELWTSVAGNTYWMVEYCGDEIIFDIEQEALDFIEEMEVEA